MKRDSYHVSAKAALYSPDGQQVLLAFYTHGMYGLPGGHVEGREDPDTTIRRELKEELGLDFKQALEKRDFFFHSTGKLILGFTGVLDPSVALHPDGHEVAAAEWSDIALIRDGAIDVGSYKSFILANSRHEAS